MSTAASRAGLRQLVRSIPLLVTIATLLIVGFQTKLMVDQTRIAAEQSRFSDAQVHYAGVVTAVAFSETLEKLDADLQKNEDNPPQNGFPDDPPLDPLPPALTLRIGNLARSLAPGANQTSPELGDLFFLLARHWASFSHLSAAGVSFEGSNLSHRRIKPAVRFSGVNLSRSNLQGSTWEPNCDFVNANLKQANLSTTEFQNVQFNRVDGEYVQFREAVLSIAVFDGSNLRNCSFEGARIDSSSFDVELIQPPEWSKERPKRFVTMLAGASFRNARLEGVSFHSANCTGADFSSASLENVQFRSTDLGGASFYGCDPKGATWDGAKIRGIRASRAFIEYAKAAGAIDADSLPNPSEAAVVETTTQPVSVPQAVAPGKR